MAVEVWYVIAGVLIVIGMLGTVLPLLPGVPVVFAGMLVAAWAGGFQQVGWVTMVVLGILTALAMLADFLASAFGTKVAGASGWAFAGAAVGALVGLAFGIVGLLVGPFAGAIAGELYASRNLARATGAGFGAVLGLLLGGLAKIALAFTMLGLFVFALLL